MGTILQLKEISMKFGSNVLFENANLTFEEGSTTALIGANGTGKSTLLKIMLRFLKPTKGTVAYRKNIRFSYVPDRLPKHNLSMNKLLTNLCLMEGLKKEEFEEKLSNYYSLFRVESMIHTPMKYLSKGSLQKVAVIQALLGSYDVLILDEPLSGQDVVSIQRFIDLMKQLHEKGVTIILSCHEPYLVDTLADKVYQIQYGNITEIHNFRTTNSESLQKFIVTITIQCNKKSLPSQFVTMMEQYRCEITSNVDDTTNLQVERVHAQLVLKSCIEHELEVIKLSQNKNDGAMKSASAQSKN